MTLQERISTLAPRQGTTLGGERGHFKNISETFNVSMKPKALKRAIMPPHLGSKLNYLASPTDSEANQGLFMRYDSRTRPHPEHNRFKS